MCEIVKRRKSEKNMYLHIIDGDTYSVKKMPIAKYEYAKHFGDDFLNAASTLTTERDLSDSYRAVLVS